MKIALAVVIRDSKILIQRRRRGNVYVHEFPGVKVDDGESFIQAACRELKEETGLTVKNIIGEFRVGETGDANQIGFVTVEIELLVQPQKMEASRDQTFFWLLPTEIPLDDFHVPDRNFIKRLNS